MSQGTYKITEAQQGRTYTGKHGDLVVWLVKLANAEAADTPGNYFELHKKPGNTPNPGDEIEVDRFAQGEHDGTPYVRIFAASMQSTTPGITSAGYSGGGKSPDQQRSIVRQHSQEMALRFIAMTGDAKDMNFGDPQVVSAYLSETVKRLTDWFANDAMAAPKPPQSASNGAPPPEVPADTAGLTPAPAGVPDDVPF